MNRAAVGTSFTFDADARARFLELVAALPARFGVVVHAYALMPNHYHLIATSERGELSRAMRFVGAEFTRSVNTAHGWDGPIFRGRFKNRVVGSDEDWRYLLLYVHANPLRAGMSRRALATCTSHGAYLGRGKPAWLDVDTMLAAYGGSKAYEAAWKAHCGGKMEAPPEFADALLWHAQPSGTFVSTAAAAAAAPDVDLDEALVRVAEVAGVSVEDLVGPVGAGRRVPARWLAAWWLSRRLGVAHTRIAAAFGSGHDAVSRDIRLRSRPGSRRSAD
jgi:REP element-mobilizing transposase RayT